MHMPDCISPTQLGFIFFPMIYLLTWYLLSLFPMSPLGPKRAVTDLCYPLPAFWAHIGPAGHCLASSTLFRWNLWGQKGRCRPQRGHDLGPCFLSWQVSSWKTELASCPAENSHTTSDSSIKYGRYPLQHHLERFLASCLEHLSLGHFP